METQILPVVIVSLIFGLLLLNKVLYGIGFESESRTIFRFIWILSIVVVLLGIIVN